MKKSLLIICGPTATGKSDLAITLAKKFNGELISADSRQVYVGMNVGTGKDLPVNAKPQISSLLSKTSNLNLDYYLIQGVRVWGYDIVSPTEDFSISQYVNIAGQIIEDIRGRGKLPIIVGGTGFYIKGITDSIDTLDIPQNIGLRKSLSEKSAAELFNILSVINPLKSMSMNASDKKNPRRLIRAIEIARFKSSLNKKSNDTPEVNMLFIGLTASKDIISEKIKIRVESRMNMGLLDEIGSLLATGVRWDSQSMQALGYRQWKHYFSIGKDKSDIENFKLKTIESWLKAEISYAKRQLTWFKKDKRINWFDITDKNLKDEVEKLIKKWQYCNNIN